MPINISAIGDEQLARQRIDDVRDIADFTPGLTISDTGPGSTGAIVLRGLNASDTSANGASFDDALGLYLGEVPLYYDFKLLDIARVEVLLGPQGTLYGLGTLAGAIRNIPNRPNLESFEGEVHGKLLRQAAQQQARLSGRWRHQHPDHQGSPRFRSSTGYFYDPGFIDYTLLLQQTFRCPSPTAPISSVRRAMPPTCAARTASISKTISTRNQPALSGERGLQAQHHLCVSAYQDRWPPVEQRFRIRHRAV